MRRDLGEAYARFKSHVAIGRGMDEGEVEEVARGRVWAGSQALERGLVDELGDFETALASAKNLAGLPPKEDVQVVPILPPRSRRLPGPFVESSGGPFLPMSERSLDTGSGQLLDSLKGIATERAWAMAPWLARVRT